MFIKTEKYFPINVGEKTYKLYAHLMRTLDDNECLCSSLKNSEYQESIFILDDGDTLWNLFCSYHDITFLLFFTKDIYNFMFITGRFKSIIHRSGDIKTYQEKMNKISSLQIYTNDSEKHLRIIHKHFAHQNILEKYKLIFSFFVNKEKMRAGL